MHSDKKNGELDQHLKKARRIADYMEEWDYKRWVKELDRVESKEGKEQKKLIAYARELQQYYLNKKQIGYSNDFKAIASFLEKCFAKDMWIQDFGKRELDIVLKQLDNRQLKGYAYMRSLKIVLSLAIQNGLSRAEECPIKTKYSPTGYDINKRKKKASKYIKKNRIKDLLEHEKDQVVDFYLNVEMPKTQKKHLAYWVLAYKLFGVNTVDIFFMKWGDIVNGVWDYNRTKTGIGSNTGKPIDKLAMQILKEYDSGGKYILDVMNGYDETPLKSFKRIHNYKGNMSRSFKKLSERIFSDGRYITWNTTRYTAPTLALEKGVDIRTVMTLMDHANYRTTSVYIGRVRERAKLKEAIDLL